MNKIKLNYFIMIVAIAFLASDQFVFAQNAKPRKSPKASVMQRIGADTDIVIASVKAYLNALNKIHFSMDRQHPQYGQV